MRKYIFIGSEKDLINNDFVYREHYDNYAKGCFDDNNETKQDLFIQINCKTKEVEIYIQCLRGHRNECLLKEGIYNPQADIYPSYIEMIESLIKEGIIKVDD